MSELHSINFICGVNIYLRNPQIVLFIFCSKNPSLNIFDKVKDSFCDEIYKKKLLIILTIEDI